MTTHPPMFVSAVYPHARFPDRFVVDLYWGMRFYTMDPWVASLCKRSREVHRAVQFVTRDRLGDEIVTAELVPVSQEAGAA